MVWPLKNGNGTVKKEEFYSELETILKEFNEGKAKALSKEWRPTDVCIRFYDQDRTCRIRTCIEKPIVSLNLFVPIDNEYATKLNLKFIDTNNEFNHYEFSLDPGMLNKVNYKPLERFFEYIPSGKSSVSFE